MGLGLVVGEVLGAAEGTGDGVGLGLVVGEVLGAVEGTGGEGGEVGSRRGKSRVIK